MPCQFSISGSITSCLDIVSGFQKGGSAIHRSPFLDMSPVYDKSVYTKLYIPAREFPSPCALPSATPCHHDKAVYLASPNPAVSTRPFAGFNLIQSPAVLSAEFHRMDPWNEAGDGHLASATINIRLQSILLTVWKLGGHSACRWGSAVPEMDPRDVYWICWPLIAL